MKFIVDAQLPFRLKKWLLNQQIDVIHTDDLPLKEFTPDIDIIKIATSQNRIVISKDSDFFKYNLIHGIPKRILIIATGNISNKDLLKLLEANFHAIMKLFKKGSEIIEINNDSIIVHKEE